VYYGEYFDWLCELINLKPGKFDILIHELYKLEFYWVTNLDSDRAEDGKILRGEFRNRGMFESKEDLERQPCSVLEALIGLSRKMDYILDDEDRGDRTRIWFWEMIGNLKLDEFTDESFDTLRAQDWKRLDRISEICNHWLSREFNNNGFGSPFPLFNPHRNQREITMIDQLNDYIMEKYMVNDELM
jgi:hypothetical protein